MTFTDVEAKTTITGFSIPDKAIILTALKTAYEGSAVAKAMFDTWIATAVNTIDIKSVAGVFQAYTIGDAGTGRLEFDLSYIKDMTYISNTGTAVKVSALHAIVHELGHALTGRKDNWKVNWLDGDNVEFIYCHRSTGNDFKGGPRIHK
jgi:hypothetical protein